MTTPNDIDAAREWQPIETAPKDSRRILAFFPTASSWYRFSVIAWSQGNNAWWSCSPAASGVCDMDQPTHWIPLPPPPKESP